MNNETFAFVYAKDKKIQVLNLENAQLHESRLLSEGWVHTSTLDAFKFLEHLHNSCEIDDLFAEINGLSQKVK